MNRNPADRAPNDARAVLPPSRHWPLPQERPRV
jgi:hypothetical protein